MGYFALRLVSPRPTFPMDMTAEERTAMNAHSVYWKAQAAEDRAIAVGPVMDPSGPFGFAFVRADSREQAQALANGDPIVASGLGFRYLVFDVPSLITKQ